MPKKRNAKRVTEVLKNIFRDRHWQDRLSINRVFIFWNEVVGAEFADLAQPDVIRAGVLWVGVSDSIWMQQLHFLKHDLLEKINLRLAAEYVSPDSRAQAPQIDDIRFKIKQVQPDNQLAEPSATPYVDLSGTVDPIREQKFDHLIKSIENNELRERVRRLWQNLEKRLD